MVYLQTAQPFLWEGVPQRDVFYAEVGSVFNKAVGDTVVVVGATGSDALYFGCIGVGHVNIGKYLVAHLSRKLKRELGWEPSLQFEEGIEKTVRWYLENQSWMDDITSGEYQQYYQSLYKDR